MFHQAEDLFLSTGLKVWHYLFILLFVVVSIGLSLGLFRTASAQSETVLSFSPGETNLFFNGVFTADVQIVISDVDLLNAYDIKFTYDPNLIVLVSWSTSDFLKNIWCPTQSNTPGSFRLACTQLRQSGVSGSGPLINLTFSGVSAGVTQLLFDENALGLSNSSSQPIAVVVQNSSANVTYHTAPITGVVSLQGRASPAGILSSLGIGTTYGQGPFSALSAATIGQNLDLGAVVGNDAYTLTVSYPGYLGVATNLAVPVGDDLTLPPLHLLAGDVNADDLVDTADLEAIGAAFDASGSGLAADLNGDGVVNLQDLALAAGNYGLTPAEAYGDWLP